MTPAFAERLTTPEFQENPYPIYREFRDQSPALWYGHSGATGGMWFITRHEDAEMVLKDQRFTKDISRVTPTPRMMAHHMLDADPPDHTRLRGLVSQAFTPRVVAALEPKIRSITEELISHTRKGENFSLIEHLAFPLPIIVIAELLGVPDRDRHLFRDWSSSLIDGADILTSGPGSNQEVQMALGSIFRYFDELIKVRRQDLQDDLISLMIAAEDSEGKLTHGEILSSCFLLLLAGHETTINLIGNGYHALLQHPEQFELLRTHPELLSSGVDELLRYDAPVQRATFRAALEDMEIAGTLIRKNQQVAAVIGSANRDERVFLNPDDLDVTRLPNKHLSFGRGIHFCLGAPLAKLEAQIAFEYLLPLGLPQIRHVERRPSTMFRGFRDLIVSWS
ncbi:cytochrome P450 family protein [Deinococcus cellulosilyticus]|uniref:Polyketide biosynthesis cytochrome P450 PksS n=1 Tax=Deinococcus cellulosilyticus (strain DSM 18568 / NBRC 106333 / KACC 11606 / 5516J-15) TaxID=1223518 RepID=A0A511N573_DEIC1|nr:cytochrome P450 [Deinococcus cellulosilyticus]GEM47638.1 polyketide biosynthesis cytochrome P450 PksS [Deinococcus cellulosilyticus NBRC 106333 = KACC 11606]